MLLDWEWVVSMGITRRQPFTGCEPLRSARSTAQSTQRQHGAHTHPGSRSCMVRPCLAEKYSPESKYLRVLWSCT